MSVVVTEDISLYYCPDCLSCPANAIQMGQATRETWAAMKKYWLKYRPCYPKYSLAVTKYPNVLSFFYGSTI